MNIAARPVPWLRIAHSICYWALSAWLIFISILVVDDLIEVYTNSDDYRRIYSSFQFYVATDWVYFVLQGVAVVAQARRLLEQRISMVALAAASAVVAIQAAIVFLNLNPLCCA